jgi:DNA-binding NarL/FixJ family response regulator
MLAVNAQTGILLVLQPRLFRAALRALLDRLLQPIRLAEAGTGMEALSLMANAPLDVAIVDPLVPGGGASLVRALRLSNPSAAVIALSRPRDRDTIVTYLQAGVCGFLDPECAPDDVILAYERARAGEIVLGARVSALLAGNAATPAAGPTIDDLSKRELEVVAEVAQGKSNSEIARELGITENTVKGHLANIYSKLQLTNRVQLTNLALDSGLATAGAGRSHLRVIA